ncbi:hypothetical protein Tco_1170194, partial [Tanacetum coccineum]
QANILLRFETLSEEYSNLAYAHELCKEMKTRFRECHKEMARLQSAYDENVSSYDQLLKDYDGAAARIKKLEEDLQKSEEGTQQLRMDQEKFTSVEYKRSLGKAFSLAIGKGFMDGVSIGRKKDDIQAILAATPEVARAYLLDPSGLQNVMSDETIPTPGKGSRNTPIASYA